MLGIALMGEMCSPMGMIPTGVAGTIFLIAIVVFCAVLYGSILPEEKDEREEIPKE